MTCDLNHTEDQRQILDAAATLLNTGYPISRLHDDQTNNLSEIAEFGAYSLALSEELGGTGFTLIEEVLIHVLFGRHMISTRVIAAPLAARLAGISGKVALANEIASGAVSVCAAVPNNDSVLLIDSEGADVALLFGQQDLGLIDLDGKGGKKITGLGQDIDLREMQAEKLVYLGKSDDNTLLNISSLLVSAQLLGIAEAARDSAVAYAQIRQQFGQPIGTFQAIKHHCANMAISAEVLSAQLDMATIAVHGKRDDADFQVSAANILASRAALDNARYCIQIHGGIGFSAEADAHHFLKQAHVLNQLGGRSIEMLDLKAPLYPFKNK